MIRIMLIQESQLLRFDAISALILEGGEEGRKIALDHAAREQNQTLKKMVQAEMRKRTGEPSPHKTKQRAPSK